MLHLVFTEGHTASRGDRLVDVRLTGEAIRLTRSLCELVPTDPEVAGLLALMLLTDARRGTRVDERGDLVPLEGQDRRRWDQDQIAEGVALLERILPVGEVGAFQLQAAIAAVHAEAPAWEATDWAQLVALYEMLERVAPGPAVTLNRAVAVAMRDGPTAALAIVGPLADDPSLRRHHPRHAVTGPLLDMAGQRAAAAERFATAARLTSSTPEQRYLNGRALAAADG